MFEYQGEVFDWVLVLHEIRATTPGYEGDVAIAIVF